ncbi:MAG: S8 family serine peptidase, partial [Bacteroidota bacterium]
MPKTGADVLHNQSNPALRLTGKGVIIGFTDTGIETGLPNFRTADGRSRVLSVWDQYETGAPPVGFTYGTEHDSSEINNGTYSMSDGGEHGTHVSGIAAGNGLPGGVYIGMAPEADIIMVANQGDDLWNHGETTVGTLDGYDYIRGKANALGKRFVINTSQGTNMGPHDGTTLFEQAVNADVTAGAIICLSAGNEAASARHASATVPKTGSVEFQFHFLGEPSYTLPLDIWYKRNDRLQIEIRKKSGGVYSAPVVPDTSQEFYFDSVTVAIINTTDSPLNGDNEMYLTVTSTLTLTSPLVMSIRFSPAAGNTLPDGGRVDMWWERNYQVAFLTHADASMTIGMPGCADSAITVASYNNRDGYGSVDDISQFSALGPRRDGVLKPDIAGLGGRIISSLPSGWGEMSGTSMSSPHVAGAVALLLQQHPTWSNAEVRWVLEHTAVADGKTGTVPNSEWGYGKLNVMRASGYVPPKPPSFTALTLNGTDATLTWTDPTQYIDGSPLTTLSDILVVRNDEVIATVAPGVKTYVNHGLTEGVYVYHLLARTSAGLVSGNSQNRMVNLFKKHNPLLLVDDDGGGSYQGYFTDALAACGRTYDYWETAQYGPVSADVLNQYVSTSGGTIWFTGSDYLTALDTSEQSALTTYLGNQGRLFITGQDIGYYLDFMGASSFMSTYLKATYVQDDVGLRGIRGAPGDILSGLLCPISGGTGAKNQDYPDEVNPVSPATSILFYDGSFGSSLGATAQKAGSKAPPTTQGISGSGTAGVKYTSGNGRVVYFAFGFEGIDVAQNRNDVMKKVTDWLFGSQFRWSSAITVRDNCGSSGQLEIGQSATATDGVDTQLGESALPGVPPSGEFDARFILQTTPAVASLRDFRNDSLHSLTWHLKFQGCAYPFTISWDTAGLVQGSILLSDEGDGSVVSVNMHTANSYT